MEIQSAKQEQPRGLLKRAYEWPKALPGYFKDKAIRVARNTIKLGRDDPRRVIHSVKVGIAITLVSLLYYSRPLYDDFGVAGMWAVLTVVVVFEFTVGGTLGKSINRGCATLAAGALGVGAQHLASLFGQTGEPIVLGIVVFLLAATSTFTRFFPQVKARYDYGVLVFILTFSMVSVSGYRVEELLVMAHQRVSTIIIGGATCVLVSLCICPIWAGEDLHNLVASNIEKLANYLECFGSEYFCYSENGESVEISNKSLTLQEYKSVLGSKSTEEILANLARWEPRHGHFRRKHPWKQYLMIGALSRQCAYQIEALNGYVNSNFQACPKDFQGRIQESCRKMSEESSKALKLLATSMKTMTRPISANPHVDNSIIAINDLKLALKACPLDPAELLAIVPAATVASILIEIVHCVEKLSQSVQELSNLAHFKVIEDTQLPKKSPSLQRCSTMKPEVGGDGCDHVIIEIEETIKDKLNTLETKADP